MPYLPRNDEQIKVDTTPGLLDGATSFVFDGTGGKPDYRGYDIVPSELTNRGIMVRGLDYSWDYLTGAFYLLQDDDKFQHDTWYNIHFQDPSPVPVPVVYVPLDNEPFIDWTYFIRNITIPNIDPTKPNNAPNLDRLRSFIAKYEPECLRKLLGWPLYRALLTESSQRMTDLVYGAEYTDYYGTTQIWKGLVQPAPRISLIANYIYYYYQEANATQTSGVNTNVPKGEASHAVSVGDKMINAWQFFSRESNWLFDFLLNGNGGFPEIYPEFTVDIYYEALRISRPNNSPF